MASAELQRFQLTAGRDRRHGTGSRWLIAALPLGPKITEAFEAVDREVAAADDLPRSSKRCSVKHESDRSVIGFPKLGIETDEMLLAHGAAIIRAAGHEVTINIEPPPDFRPPTASELPLMQAILAV